MAQISKELLRALRVDIDAALADVAKKHGLQQLHAGSCTYDPAGAFTFKLEGVAEGGVDKNGGRYINEYKMLGLPPLGTTFKQRSGMFTIAGLTGGGKVIAANEQGKRYVFDMETVKAIVKAQGGQS
jgi:hypothetical protein